MDDAVHSSSLNSLGSSCCRWTEGHEMRYWRHERGVLTKMSRDGRQEVKERARASICQLFRLFFNARARAHGRRMTRILCSSSSLPPTVLGVKG